MNDKVLFVDDEENVLQGYTRHLRKKYQVATAASGRRGLELVDSNGPFAVVVSDMRMPQMDGLEFLKSVKDRAPDTVRLMLTGNADQKTAVDAVNEGCVFRFINKPLSPDALASALDESVAHYRLATAERALLEGTVNGTINLLTDILSMVCPETFGHAVVLRRRACALAAAMQLPDTWALEMAATLSPIADVTVPAEVLEMERNGDELDDEHRQMLDSRPETASKLLGNIPRLERVAEIVLYNQKGFDGTGFPDAPVRGADLPIESRVLKVLRDVAELEARGRSLAEALQHARDQHGRYDPQVLEAAFKALDSAEEQAIATATLDIWKLRPGHTLISAIEAEDGRLLVGPGMVITPTLVQRLRNLSRVMKIKDSILVQLTESSNG